MNNLLIHVSRGGHTADGDVSCNGYSIRFIHRFDQHDVTADGVRSLDGFVLDDSYRPVGIRDIDPPTTNIGQFSFVCLELEKKKLSVYADVFASKSLFYFANEDTALISDDISLIIGVLGKLHPNRDTMLQWLYWGYLNTSRETFFEGIYRLLAAERLEVLLEDRLAVKKTKYYHIKLEPVEGPHFGEAVSQLEKNLHGYLAAVNELYDNRVGISLSSGLDSNLIRLLYEERFSLRPPCYTHSYPEDEYSEYLLLEKRPELKNIVSSADSLEGLVDYLAMSCQPISGLPSIGTFKLYRAAAQDGLGGLIANIGDALWYNGPVGGYKLVAADGDPLGQSDYVKLPPDVRSDHGAEEAEFGSFDTVHRAILEQQFIYKGPKVNHDHAIASKKAGIQPLHPFLDRRNLELAMSLPESTLYFRERPKSLVYALVRQYYQGEFPKGLKMISPQREYLKTFCRDSIMKLIQASYLAKDGYVDKELCLSAFTEYTSKSELGNSFFIWKFVVGELWYRLFEYGEATRLACRA